MKQVPKTLDDIKAMTDDFLIPAQVAPILGCDPHSIRVQAHKDPTKFGFPVSCIGSRVRISRMGFIRWMEG